MEWKSISIRMRVPDNHEDGIVEILEGEAEKSSFEMKDLGPIAYRALAETVKTLNVLAHPSEKIRNIERVYPGALRT